MNKVMYIAINNDLNMSPGKIGAQSAHAIKEFIYQSLIPNGKLFNSEKGIMGAINSLDEFIAKGNTIITLKATNNQMLEFESEGYIVIRDYGRTEVDPGSLTAACLGIYDKEDKDNPVPKFIQRLRLL